MDDACDEGGEFLLAVYKVGFVERGNCRLEDVVAEIVTNRRRIFEARKESAQDADNGYHGSRVADADSGVAEKEDGLEDRGRGEDEVAHWRAVGVPTALIVLSGEFYSNVSF